MKGEAISAKETQVGVGDLLPTRKRPKGPYYKHLNDYAVIVSASSSDRGIIWKSYMSAESAKIAESQLRDRYKHWNFTAVKFIDS